MRLIDADTLKESIQCSGTDEKKMISTKELYKSLISWIDNRPTIEPEWKTGKWIKGGEQPYFRKHFDIVVCSICNKRGEHRWNFCPNCGSYNGGKDDGDE